MKIATIKNVRALFDFEISNSCAWNHIDKCRRALDKQDKILTLEEFCNFHKLPY